MKTLQSRNVAKLPEQWYACGTAITMCSKVEIKQNNQNHIGDMVFLFTIHDATLLM